MTLFQALAVQSNRKNIVFMLLGGVYSFFGVLGGIYYRDTSTGWRWQPGFEKCPGAVPSGELMLNISRWTIVTTFLYLLLTRWHVRRWLIIGLNIVTLFLPYLGWLQATLAMGYQAMHCRNEFDVRPPISDMVRSAAFGLIEWILVGYAIVELVLHNRRPATSIVLEEHPYTEV